MWPPTGGSAARFLRALDPASRLRLRIFAFKLLLVILFSVAIATQRGIPLLQLVAFLCFCHAIFSGMAALFQRQTYRAAFLTAWDETAAFLAIALLAHLLDAHTA